MKRIFLITIAIIITVSMILIGTGCKTAATTAPVVPEFIGEDFELTLPENWEGAVKEELDSVIDKLEEAGLTELAEAVEGNKKYLVYFGYDTEMAAQGSDQNNFTIAGESKIVISLEEYMDISYESLKEQYEKAGHSFDIVKQEIVTLGDNEEVGRTIFEYAVEDYEAKVAQYIIKNVSDVWVLTFSMKVEQFDEHINDFDKSIESFKILD